MSFLFTPNRKVQSSNRNNHHEDEDVSAYVNDNKNDGLANDDISNAANTDNTIKSNRKKNAKQHIGQRGSILHRNTERKDHLRRLYLKRCMSEAIIKSITPKWTEKDEIIDQHRDENDDGEEEKKPTMFQFPMERLDSITEYDESFVQELRNEVEEELDKDKESAKILEMKTLFKKYKNVIKADNVFPLEIRLKNVSFTVPVDEKNSKIQTVYNASFVYPLFKFLKQRLWLCKSSPEKDIRSKKVISNVNLILKPGRQYLLLGPPGAGKTTLLQAIVGHLQSTKGELLEGDILYNGRALDCSKEFFIDNAFAYIDQLDQHAPRLTVQETFEFAYQCSTGGRFIRQAVSPEVEADLNDMEKEHVATQMILAALGLTEVKDTYVGDTNIRGVSGGQRRRVTVGEMLMSRAPILCGDEISTGLDAASTYDMIQILLHFGRSFQNTRIISLLQPSPETVSLFDEVIVLSEGEIIYAGPIVEVEDYFASIGFRSPEFTDVADFLQMVSTADGADLYDPVNSATQDAKSKAPNSSELAKIFRNSKFHSNIVHDLGSPLPYVWTQSEGSKIGAEVSNLVMSDAVRKRYANRFARSTYLIVHRFTTLWLRDKRVIIAGAVKNILMGVSVGGVFFDMSDQLSIQGALFQAGLFIMLGSMQSSSSLIQDRIVFYKHYNANFYSAWPFIFGRTISQMPQTIFDTITFSTLLYYFIGLADRSSPSNFFVYLSILITFAMMMNAQMGLFASFGNASQVQVYGACTLLAMMLFCGFIITPDNIPKYFVWVYWWNPFAWAYRALVINEFRSARWDDPHTTLEQNGFIDNQGNVFGQIWVGYAFLFMVPYWLLCCVASAMGLSSFIPDTHALSEVFGDHADLTACQKERITIPFTPVTLSFCDVCYEVTASTTKEQLKLLKNVNGIFRPGKMCALMGSSGAGKTTLLDVIALRKRSGIFGGEVLLNGFPQDRTSFRRCSGYVEQFDVQSPELTVRETVIFSARLRLDPMVVDCDEKKLEFVDHILDEVELTLLANSLVGSEECVGLTFEQRKRLSIAVELASSPSILFLDEPTSGLDARSAKVVVKTLRRIADSNRTICATIHQPSSVVFGMFDDLLLLKRGGRVVYHGPLGQNCHNIISYFEGQGVQPIALGENPANWMLRAITDDQHQDLADAYVKSKEFASLQAELDSIKSSCDESKKILYTTEYATSWARRRDLVSRRLQRIYWRSPTYNLARIMVSLLIALVLGSVFIVDRDTPRFTEREIRARLSVIYMSFTITGIMAILSVLPVMTKIRDMFYRQCDAGMYDSASMGLALGVAEKYFILLSTSLFVIVFQTTAAMGNGLEGLIAFWGFFTFNFAIYSYVGQLFVCMVKPAATALILCSVFIGINNFFSGLIVRPQFMVGGFYAVPYYISPGHYVYESLVMSLYKTDDTPVIASPGSELYDWLVNEGLCTTGEQECIGQVDQYVYIFFGGEFTSENQLRNALILGFILALFRLLTWLSLKHIRFSN